jgi:hypothetical protein
MMARGQNPVSDDWRRLRPTNPVKNSQYGLCTMERITLRRIKLPAKANTIRSKFIMTSF